MLMAIDPSYYDENNQIQVSHAASSKGNGQAQSPFTIQRLMSTGSASSATSKRHKVKNNNNTTYVSSDRVQLLSHLTEEKGDKKVMSSFQLAANIYKSNSDEFKLKKRLGKRSNKKSVLTLPNEPSILPQTCTVSDMNDSEYCNRNDKPKAPKPKKRLAVRKNRRPPPNKEYEFYDRDADYCSQMNIYLDCSSTDVVKNFKGDCRRRARDSYSSKNKSDDDVAPHDVWAVLRNINRFQFHPSPPMSDESSIVSPRKKKVVKKKLKRGVYETCRTEQIAYISSIELNVKSPRDGSLSGSSSIITVIDNKDGFNKICQQVQKTFGKNVPQIKSKNIGEKPMKANHNSNKTRNNNKALCCTNRSSECKTTNNQTDVLQTEPNRAKNTYASKETLIAQKSEISIISDKTSKRNDSLGEISCEGDICTEVEMQTDLENKEDTHKPRIHSKVNGTHRNIVNAGALGDANYQSPNIYGQHDAKALLRRPLPSRVPWYNSNAQARPILPPTRPLMSGPTKIVPGPTKAPLTLSKLEECPRIPHHQATTITGTTPMSTFTQSDIRRHVARIKFPLVILGRDQLRGEFKVDDYDYSQFNGLDEHVWPFMLDWTDQTRNSLESDLRDSSYIVKPTNNQKPTLNKATLKDKKSMIADVDPSKCKAKELIRSKNQHESKNGAAKLKPILQFRDKMLKLLYKKASDQNIVDNIPSTCVQGEEKTVNSVEIKSHNIDLKNWNTIGVATSSISIVPPREVQLLGRPVNALRPSPPPPTSPSKILLPPKLREKKRKWSKAKWASDMIENVIKKIKNGTYYTNDLQSSSEVQYRQNNTSDTDDLKLQVNDSKEVSVQVTMPVVTGDFTPKITIQKKKEPLIMLPGFNEVLPPLEIKSMTRNQIAVKHCVTNVLLQFDVNVPLETDQTGATFNRSTSCIPLSVTESKTKVFKCKARILNAMLPAELCSIIPKVMKQFVDKDAQLSLTLHEDNKMSPIFPSSRSIMAPLSPISEYTVSEIQETAKLPLLPQIVILPDPELRRLSNGRFSRNPKLCTAKSDPNENIYIIALNELPYMYHSLEEELLPRPIINSQYYFEAQLYHPLILNSTKPKSPTTSIPFIPPDTVNLCTDLMPYSSNVMTYGECTNIQNVSQIVLRQFLKAIQQRTTNYIPNSLFPSIQLQTYNNHISVNVKFGNHQAIGPTVNVNLTNLKLGILYQSTTRCLLNTTSKYASTDHPEKRIEYIKHAEKKEFKKVPREKSLPNVISKYKRMGHVRYVKLYKKCKSTSHIAAERSSTPLSKVTNLDDFFQAMGAGKLLSSAFDGSCGKKILFCISELKNWITEITPRQALLVMLLTNKKDTSNLVRFRPIILQGIAVNRITRVNELDMEIEVIERESFNKLSAYPGLPSILESTHNNDSLFEELCWIAKNTASDYQRRFDESSEKLLKALLEKRKKLNPSYLRVMARYVGLGLLKTPVNH